jgi:hypothetical protein
MKQFVCIPRLPGCIPRLPGCIPGRHTVEMYWKILHSAPAGCIPRLPGCIPGMQRRKVL